MSLVKNYNRPTGLRNLNEIMAKVMTASIGPSNVKLNSSHINRDNAAYYIEIGNFLCNMARIVPDGLLVFFPSYYVLNSCTNLSQLYI